MPIAGVTTRLVRSSLLCPIVLAIGMAGAMAQSGHTEGHAPGLGSHSHGPSTGVIDRGNPATSAPSSFPRRENTPLRRAYHQHAHRTVADACETPGPLEKVSVKAGRAFARPGEVFGFEPRVLKVAPCAKVEVTYQNLDAVRHTFMLPGLNSMPNIEIVGHGTRTVRFIAPANDITLAYHCHVPQHEKMGMAGWLIVGEGGFPAAGPESASTAPLDAADPGPAVHDVEATIVSVDRRRRMIIADHEEIPSVMASMVMGFAVDPPELLADINEKDRVRLSLRVADLTVTGIETLNAAPAAGAEPTPSAEVTLQTSGGASTVVEVKGTVIAKLAERNELLVDHDDIPGHMPSMVMAFKLRDPALLDAVGEGEERVFRIDMGENEIVSLSSSGDLVAKVEPKAKSPAKQASLPGMARDAFRFGADLDGDGDPDEIDIRLEIIEIEEEIWPGKFLNSWVFAPAGAGMASIARGPGPVLRVEEGDLVNIRLENTHYLPHTLHLHGTIHPNAIDGVPVITQPAVMPGESFDYRFKAVNPGTHFYHCHVQPDVHVPMGLVGMLVIEENRPNNNFTPLVIGGGAMPDMSAAVDEEYDREYALIYSDADDRMNRIPVETASAADIERLMHREFDTTRYEPNVFMLNGRSFPFTLRDSPIRVRTGERVKLRVLNAGSRVVSLHTHGHRTEITHLDGNTVAESARVTRDVVTISAAQRVDMDLRAEPDTPYSSGPGVWLMHDHTEHAATNAGLSPGGDVTAIVYEDHWDDRKSLPKTALPLDRYMDAAYYRGEVPTFPDDVYRERSLDIASLGPVREGLGWVLAVSEQEGGLITLDRDPANGILPGVGDYTVWDASLLEIAGPGDRVRYTLDTETGSLLLVEAVQP